MIETLIVDDEIYVRLGLVSMINWEELGFTIVGQATNGKMALEIAHQLSPQLIITDIRMPVMDGLAFVQELRKSGNKAKVIILSLYDDFYKLREASRLGIFDYLLKSELVDAKKLTAMLIQLRQEIESTSDPSLPNKKDLETHLFFELTNPSDTSCENLSMILKKLEIDSAMHIFVLFSLDDYKLKSQNEDDSPNKQNVFTRSVQYLSSGLLVNQRAAIAGSIAENAFVCVFFGDNKENLFQSAHTFVTDLKKEVFKIIGYTVFAAMSEICENEYILRNYRNVYNLFDKRLFFNYDSCVSVKDLRTVKNNYPDIAKLLLKFSKHLSPSNAEEFYGLIDTVINEASDSFNINTADSISVELATTVQHMIKMFSTFPSDTDFKCTDVLKYDTLKKRRDFLVGQITATLSNKEGSHHLDRKIIHYLNNNFDQSISLQDIAAHVHMSPAYVSHMYKKISGENIFDTLTRIRLERAKKLLLDTQLNLKIYEISERVGFDNARYFSQLFKKVVGCTPIEYKTNQN